MPETQVPYCQMCAANCGVRVTVEDGRIASIAPDRDHPLSRSHLCLLGRAAADLVDDAARLDRPRRRVDERFVPVAWNDALGEIAKRLLAIRARSGPRALALYWGGGHLHFVAAYRARWAEDRPRAEKSERSRRGGPAFLGVGLLRVAAAC